MTDKIARVWNGSEWVVVSSPVGVPNSIAVYQQEPPLSPVAGQLWVDSDNDETGNYFISSTVDLNNFVTQAQLDLKSPISSPTFTGIPSAPTATAATNTTQLATTAFVTTADNLKANIASPSFTGTVTVPSGSVSSPSISPSGDTNTGIFFPAADTIAFSEGGTEAMRIDSSGRVTMPYQPSATVTRINHVTSTGVIVFESALSNVGSHYNTSNGRFTCPVTGHYFISFSTLLYSMGSPTYVNLRVNGATYGSWGSFGVYGQFTGSYAGQGASAIISANANDYIDLYCTHNGTNLHNYYTWASFCLIK